MPRGLALLLFSSWLTACAGDPVDPSRAPNHPANPQSSEAATAPPSTTLAGDLPPSSTGPLNPCATTTCPANQRCMMMGSPAKPMCM